MSKLIHIERKCWKEEVICQIFLPVDVEAILGIPLSIRMPSDCLIWAKTNNGCFIVRNAYKVAMNLHRTDHTTSTSLDSSHRVFWRKLW